MKLITIVAAATSAALVSGTNKTLAPTPGVDRPNAPPPITPFPTEPNVVSYAFDMSEGAVSVSIID